MRFTHSASGVTTAFQISQCGGVASGLGGPTNFFWAKPAVWQLFICSRKEELSRFCYVCSVYSGFYVIFKSFGGDKVNQQIKKRSTIIARSSSGNKCWRLSPTPLADTRERNKHSKVGACFEGAQWQHCWGVIWSYATALGSSTVNICSCEVTHCKWITV